MKKLLSFLCLVGILFAFQAKLNAIPKYLVIDLETRASRYTDEAPDLRNDTCRTTELWLRYIPAGTFTMGSPVGEDGREDPSDETQHQVTLSQPYYIGVFEVTQAQWEAIMNFGAPIVWGGETIPARPSYFKNDEHYATRPVESVSYYMIRGEEAGTGWPNSDEVDDLSFMGLLRELTGLKFDLPTEAQWEYACRAGTTTALNSGKALFDPEDKVENMDAVGRYMYNSGFYKDFLDDEGNRELSVDEFGTAKVGSYAPNAWGLYDMHGNVVEWCLDWFYGDDYSVDDVTDPVGEEFDPDLEVSVCRGGSWCSEPYKCRSAFRGISNSYADDYENGFRLVCLTMPETHTVTVVNGTDNKGDAINDEKVTITADNPPDGMVFDKWTSDDVTFDNANDAETTFQMPDKAVTVTATYKNAEIPKYTVRVIQGSADKTEAVAGETVTIKAMPAPNRQIFDCWTSRGNNVQFADANATETTFVMPAANVTVTATYKNAPKYTVTVENGTADKTEAYAGDLITITANTPDEHKLFDSWTGRDVTFANAKAAQTTFVMPAKAVTVTATYADEPKYTVTVENGTADKTEAYSGETFTIVAVFPSENLVFDKWTSDDVTFANANAMQTTFVMPANAVMVTAAYKTRLTYTVTVINGTANTTEAQAGDAVIITANDPAEHKLFDEWTGSTPFPNTKDAQVTFCMPPDDITVIATYKDEPKYAVTVENGTADKTEAYAGETITITANDPAEHFQFDSWTGDVEFTNADAVQTTFAMPANAVTVTAAYLEDPKYTVTVVGGKANKRTAYEGEEITITANRPASGQAFDAWSGDVDLADATATPTTFTMPGRAVSVTATFKTLPKTYKIVVVNGTTDKAKAAAGEIVTLTANNPPAGKVFDRWTGGAVFDDPNSPTTTFIMPAKAVTPKALYKRK